MRHIMSNKVGALVAAPFMGAFLAGSAAAAPEVCNWRTARDLANAGDYTALCECTQITPSFMERLQMRSDFETTLQVTVAQCPGLAELLIDLPSASISTAVRGEDRNSDPSQPDSPAGPGGGGDNGPDNGNGGPDDGNEGPSDDSGNTDPGKDPGKGGGKSDSDKGPGKGGDYGASDPGKGGGKGNEDPGKGGGKGGSNAKNDGGGEGRSGKGGSKGKG